MNNYLKVLAVVFKAGAAVAVALWAGWPLAIRLLAIFMGLDFLTGIVKGGMTGTLASSVSLRGLLKKLAVCVAVLVVHVLDSAIAQSFFPGIPLNGGELGLDRMFALYLVVNELISIIENLAASGVSFPKPLIEMLVKIKSSGPSAATQKDIDQLNGVQQVNTTGPTTVIQVSSPAAPTEPAPHV